MSALLSHAELTRPRSTRAQSAEARRAPRRTRYGNLTLFPRVENALPESPVREAMEEPRVIASISNISTTGLGLILSEELPRGLEFDVDWNEGESPVPLRFEVVHSQPVSAGMYRTGARLIAGELPEPQVPTDFVNMDQSDPEQDATDAVSDKTTSEPAPVEFAGGILKFEPAVSDSSEDLKIPAPAGTFRASSASGFEKTETLAGVTTCGWDRSITLRRADNRLWVYIHSPGKKNGWGIFVDANQFESAYNRVQQAAGSPFISTLAA
jgi:hypothetical protein